jgi:hypothetical protein
LIQGAFIGRLSEGGAIPETTIKQVDGCASFARGYVAERAVSLDPKDFIRLGESGLGRKTAAYPE